MITLTNALSYSEGTTVVESDANNALVQMSQNWQTANQLTVELAYGNMVSGAFVQGQRAHAVRVILDFSSGTWTASNGLSGTLSSTQLSQIQSALRQARNIVEQFATTAGVVPGTQTPWT